MPAEITSAVWGHAPWSDELLKVSGDVDRGRADRLDFIEQLGKDFGADFKALREAGITYTSGDWGGGTRDYFRSTVVGSEGFQDGIHEAPVTRWFDTNTFFRRPTIEGDLSYGSDGKHGLLQTYVEIPGDPSVYEPTFLSPYAFARLAGRAEDVSETDAHRHVGDLYDQLLADAEQQGLTHVLFHEPFAPYNGIDKRERATLKNAVGSLAANHPGLNVGIYFGFGNGAEFVSDFAADDRIAAIGCDLQRTPAAELPKLPGHRFLAGIVDGANTLIRDDEELAAELEIVTAAVEAPEITVTHSVDLEFVPRAYALQKIAQIGRLAQEGGEEI